MTDRAPRRMVQPTAPPLPPIPLAPLGVTVPLDPDPMPDPAPLPTVATVDPPRDRRRAITGTEKNADRWRERCQATGSDADCRNA
jgi:hypothetical protein